MVLQVICVSPYISWPDLIKKHFTIACWPSWLCARFCNTPQMVPSFPGLLTWLWEASETCLGFLKTQGRIQKEKGSKAHTSTKQREKEMGSMMRKLLFYFYR